MRISTKKNKEVLHTEYQLHGHTLDVIDISKYLGVTSKDDLSVQKLTEQWASSEETSKNASLQWKTLRTRQWYDLSWSMHQQSGTLIHRTISSPWSRLNVELCALSPTITNPELPGGSPESESELFTGDTSERQSFIKMLDDLKWERLEDRRRLDTLSMIYRMQHGLVAIHPSSFKTGQ